jgi:hypothetical protein
VFLLKPAKQANSFTGLDLRLLLSGGGGVDIIKIALKNANLRLFLQKTRKFEKLVFFLTAIFK